MWKFMKPEGCQGGLGVFWKGIKQSLVRILMICIFRFSEKLEKLKVEKTLPFLVLVFFFFFKSVV